MKTFRKFGIEIPTIYLPSEKNNLAKWSVIACDQYTQDKEYWQKVESFVGDKPSTLNITLPEVYLNDADKPERIKNIKKTMHKYFEDKVFTEYSNQCFYIERTTEYGRVRKGLVTAIDLETYDWKPFTTSLIRATEATILDRIPPRMEIRRDAEIELPHIMLLVNDKNKSLIEQTGVLAKQNNPVYQTELMMNSGKISGWSINTAEEYSQMQKSLEELVISQKQKDNSVFLFAVGDGNHSLATAKAVWDEYKLKNGGKKLDDGSITIPSSIENHNARFALIEIVNIYDEGLTFEPIHRVLFNINNDNLLDSLSKKLNGEIVEYTSKEELASMISNSKADFGFVYTNNNKTFYKCIKTKITDLAVSKLQPAIDDFLADFKSDKSVGIDYIHGTDEVFRLGQKSGNTCILLPPIAKETFFTTIATSGPLPRKSFSMGEASEKRFYMECRKLF